MSLDRDYQNKTAPRDSVAGIALRAALLSAQIFVLVMLSAFPFKFWHFAEVRPAFLLMAAYYWAVFRPQAFPPAAAFAAGLLLDLLYAAPPGLNALTLVAAQWFTRAQRRLLAGQSFLLLWMCFFLMAAAAFLFQWVVFSLFALAPMPARPALVSIALTGLLFPPMAALFHVFGRGLARRGG